jgi:cysteine desulfurase / selenocysteine lyase
MTTPIPTSDFRVPDETLLARWANEFLRAVPGLSVGADHTAGAVPVTGKSAPEVVPSTSRAGLPGAESTSGGLGSDGSRDAIAAAPVNPVASEFAPPRSVPLADPDTNTPAPVDVGGAHRSVGVPEAYAAALPTIDPPSLPVPFPSTPYYFVAEAVPYLSSVPLAHGIEPADPLVGHGDALPGMRDLEMLLQSFRDSEDRPPSSASNGSNDARFYFLDAVPNVPATGHPAFDVQSVRRDFPILSERVDGGKPLVWLDNAATTHKPQAVIDRLTHFYRHENSNIHRAAHELAARATDAYESARAKVARFLGAASSDEIVFVRGATEGINLVAQSWGRQNIGAGDEIIVSHLEHHANIVPWQQLASEKGARLRVIPVDDRGQILLDEYRKLLTDRTKLVSVTQVSNALGTIVPVKEIVEAAHAAGARVLIDGAQSVPHLRVNLQSLDADFFVFSGHKIFGPTGIGVVYGKSELLDAMPPWQGGGNMIADVTFERTVYQTAPSRFEAGTGNIADAVGLGAALDYVERIGLENIARYEHDLLAYATRALGSVPGLRLIGTAAEKASVSSFVLHGYRVDEMGQALSREGIAVRAGHHCAQPILRRFGLEATVRPSLAFYNTCAEIDALVAVLLRLAHARPVPHPGGRASRP